MKKQLISLKWEEQIKVAVNQSLNTRQAYLLACFYLVFRWVLASLYEGVSVGWSRSGPVFFLATLDNSRSTHGLERWATLGNSEDGSIGQLLATFES